jgi:hypothetical protein
MVNRSSDVNGSDIMTKEHTLDQVFDQLKKDLRSNFSFETPKDQEDGLLTREFFVRMHVLIYKYKKYGQDMLEEANFQQRINLLEQKDIIDQEGVNASPEDQAKGKEFQTEYTAILKSETKDMETYTINLQDHVFDYFNLIVKEYYMSLDKWGADNEYVKLIKEEYKKIDDEADDEEAKEEIPEFLNQATAE